jgi:nucleoside-diphosphate-sugar epimerase
LNVLVTGAAGFVGSRLVSKLLGERHKVFAVVRSVDQVLPTGTTAVPADLSELEVERLPSNIDAVIALAQSRNYQDFPESAQEVFQVNACANLKLMDWARRNGVRKFVLASSGGVYTRCERLHMAESDHLSTMEIDYYLSTKLMAELVLQSFARFFDTAVILRPFFVYGPGQPAHLLLARLISSVCAGRRVRLEGNDGPRINPVFVDDAAAAFDAALSLEGGHALNVAGPDILSIRQVCESIGRLVGRSPSFEVADGLSADIIGSVALGLPRLNLNQTSFETGLARTLTPGTQ